MTGVVFHIGQYVVAREFSRNGGRSATVVGKERPDGTLDIIEVVTEAPAAVVDLSPSDYREVP